MHARESIRAQQTSAHTQSVPCRCFTLTLGSPQGQLIGHKVEGAVFLVQPRANSPPKINMREQ